MKDIPETIRSVFPTKKIVIAGDIVADQFLHGTIARVSREAPVFILRHDNTDTLGGAAANAAVNIASLGGTPLLVGLAGNDENGRLLLEALESAGVTCDNIIVDDQFRTTTKVRVLAGQYYAPRQQVIRIDYENDAQINSAVRAKLCDNLALAAADADAIIISDYNYGVADAELVETARNISKERRIPLLIDSRFRLRDFPNATTATPNSDEVEHILGKGFSELDCDRLREDLGYESLLVTCGNKGMLLVEKNKSPLSIQAVGSTEPVDVTGAGDTVIAVFALGMASGLSFSEAAQVANHAGGIVVMKKGTSAVTTQELLDSVREASESAFSDAAG